MELLKKKVSELIPYVNNSRTHSEEQITQIASSIKEFGFTNPILIEQDNTIIAGHGRLLASKKLGLEEVPCITITGLTKTQIKALIIADNQLALNAGWDLEKLSVEIEGLQEDNFDIKLLGFNNDFLKDIIFNEKDIETTMPILNEGNKPPFQQITFTIHNENFPHIKTALDKAKNLEIINDLDDNINAKAIIEICKFYANNC